MKYTVVDTEPSERFPIWTRGNAGEVYPNPLTPMSGSLFGEASAQGQMAAFLSFGVITPRDLREAGRVGSGVFGGYLYINLSIGRLFAVRMPGVSVADVDVQMAGSAGTAPPYERNWRDLNPIASLQGLRRIGVRMGRPNLDEVTAARLATDRWRATVPPPATQTDAELVAFVRSYPPRFAEGMRLLLATSVYAGAGGAAMDRFAEQAKARPGTAQLCTAGLGTIDSAGPAMRLWALGRQVAASGHLSALFDAGEDPASHAGDPDVDSFIAEYSSFVAAYGARAPDEWELASGTWGTDAHIALAAIERLRHAPEDRDPELAQRRLAADRTVALGEIRTGLARPVRRVFDRLAGAAALYAEGRERAKATLIDDVYPLRLALFELAARARARGGPQDRFDAFMVTDDELADFVAHPNGFAKTIAERRALWDALAALEPPFVFSGEISDPATWPRRDAELVSADGGSAQLQGMGVCPGVARGTVRIVTDPASPGDLGPGDILVAPITDPAWTPLFLAAAGVIVEVGAQLSHAAIVARELGIPTVVSVAGATRRLHDGQLVEIDGASGRVTILAGTP